MTAEVSGRFCLRANQYLTTTHMCTVSTCYTVYTMLHLVTYKDNNYQPLMYLNVTNACSHASDSKGKRMSAYWSEISKLNKREIY